MNSSQKDNKEVITQFKLYGTFEFKLRKKIEEIEKEEEKRKGSLQVLKDRIEKKDRRRRWKKDLKLPKLKGR
jgi:hypothetical protein